MSKKKKNDSENSEKTENSDAYNEYLKNEIENLKENINCGNNDFHRDNNDNDDDNEDDDGDETADNVWADESDYEDLGENGKEAYLNTQNIANNSEDMPLCSFFLETRKKASRKSVLSWIRTCDEDSLNMILEHIREIREKTMVDEMQPKKNIRDIFDSPETAIENDEEYQNKEEDIYGLAALIIAWEHDNFMIPSSLLDKAVFLLAVYVVGEFGRRDGTIKITGNGTLLSEKTLFTPIKKAKGEFLKSMINLTPKRLKKTKKNSQK